MEGYTLDLQLQEVVRVVTMHSTRSCGAFCRFQIGNAEHDCFANQLVFKPAQYVLGLLAYRKARESGTV